MCYTTLNGIWRMDLTDTFYNMSNIGISTHSSTNDQITSGFFTKTSATGYITFIRMKTAVEGSGVVDIYIDGNLYIPDGIALTDAVNIFAYSINGLENGDHVFEVYLRSNVEGVSVVLNDLVIQTYLVCVSLAYLSDTIVHIDTFFRTDDWGFSTHSGDEEEIIRGSLLRIKTAINLMVKCFFDISGVTGNGGQVVLYIGSKDIVIPFTTNGHFEFVQDISDIPYGVQEFYVTIKTNSPLDEIRVYNINMQIFKEI